MLLNCMMNKFICLFGLCLLLSKSSCEVYTALVDLEQLLGTEKILIESLKNYIDAQKQKIDLLNKYVKVYQQQSDIASKDVQNYVANPINAYLLVKRLVTDWKTVEELANTNVGIDIINNITKNNKMPTYEDLNGAAVALTRLQDTYNLDTSSLARGELNGVKYSTELSAADCFELGRQAYNNEDYYHTLLWMREADKKIDRMPNETIQRSDILEYLAFSSFKQGNVPLALDLTNKLLDLIPQHSRALGNKIYYEDELKKTDNVKRKGEDEKLDLSFVDHQKPDGWHESRALYEQLCRGEVTLPEKEKSKLICYYDHKNHPFLKIAPFKVEEAYRDPKIVIFHDVMYDNEIETVKSLAQPRFQRATVQNSVTGELETATYRISKSSWIKTHEHKHIQNIVQRVEDMTNLDQISAEDLQVVNYGIGGHYEPHYDFARKDEKNAFKSLGTGNRIATVLFYMSDVAQGGATVFTTIKTAVWPKKGTAVFWYNLYPNGEGNALTRHAACPVLTGSKWVSNKWIHEHNQEFRRPCDLKPTPSDHIA